MRVCWASNSATPHRDAMLTELAQKGNLKKFWMETWFSDVGLVRDSFRVLGASASVHRCAGALQSRCHSRIECLAWISRGRQPCTLILMSQNNKSTKGTGTQLTPAPHTPRTPRRTDPAWCSNSNLRSSHSCLRRLHHLPPPLPHISPTLKTTGPAPVTTAVTPPPAPPSPPWYCSCYC